MSVLNYKLQGNLPSKEAYMHSKLILLMVLLGLSACGQKGLLFIESDASTEKQETQQSENPVTNETPSDS